MIMCHIFKLSLVKTDNSKPIRILNHARKNEQDFMVVLVAYGLERLIYRLSISDYRDRYVLKGGMLVTLWTIDPGRFTRDVDFLAFGDDDEPTLIKEFADILNIQVEDGLIFDTADIAAAPIRDDQVYGGMRLRTALEPFYGNANAHFYFVSICAHRAQYTMK